IVVSRDLALFQHLHPQPAPGRPGSYAVELSVPRAGSYLLFDEFTRRDGRRVLARDGLTVGTEQAAGAAQLAVDRAPKGVEGLRIALWGTRELKAGEAAQIRLLIEDAATGEPVDDLVPYLGAPAHVVILSQDAASFAHEHGERAGAPASPAAGH